MLDILLGVALTLILLMFVAWLFAQIMEALEMVLSPSVIGALAVAGVGTILFLLLVGGR